MKLNRCFFKQAFLVLFLFFANTLVYSQQKPTKIIFEVIDENGGNVNDVYLIQDSTNVLLGVSERGKMELYTSERLLSATFSHLSYEKQKVKIRNNFQEKVQFIEIVLKDKLFGIGQVSISAKTTELAYKNELINVMDYEFYNNSLLMLCGLGKNKQLRLASKNGYDITSMFLPRGAKAIYKDCLNKIYLIYKDSVYLVQFTDTNLFIVDPYPRGQFESTVTLCEAAIDDNLIVAKKDQTDQQIDFYHKPKGTSKYDFFRRIVNYWDKAISNNYLRAYGVLNETGVNTASANTLSGLMASRQLDRDYTYYKYILSTPLFTPIFVIKNQFVLFDTYHGQVEWYEPNGKLKKADSIDFTAQKYWANLLLFDEEEEQVYAFKKDGQKKYIQHVDYNTGEFGDIVQLEEHPFSENYRIKEGYIYYLYRETHQPGLVKKLYKQRL